MKSNEEIKNEVVKFALNFVGKDYSHLGSAPNNTDTHL